jgi:UDP-glucose 4-epimerase
VSVIGKRSTHGIIYDLIQKLKKNPKELEILGDGTQTKSYLHVHDCVEGVAVGVKQSKNEKGVSIFNPGSFRLNTGS